MCLQVNLAVMLNAINHTKSALVFLENALQVNKKYVQSVFYSVLMVLCKAPNTPSMLMYTYVRT